MRQSVSLKLSELTGGALAPTTPTKKAGADWVICEDSVNGGAPTQEKCANVVIKGAAARKAVNTMAESEQEEWILVDTPAQELECKVALLEEEVAAARKVAECEQQARAQLERKAWAASVRAWAASVRRLSFGASRYHRQHFQDTSACVLDLAQPGSQG